MGSDVRLWIASQGPETERLRQITAGRPADRVAPG